jgi:hypothetical protein
VLSAGQGGFGVVNASDPDSLSFGSFSAIGRIDEVATGGGLAYLATFSGGEVLIYNVSNPASPSSVTSVSHSALAGVHGLVYHEGLVYAAGLFANSVAIIDPAP